MAGVTIPPTRERFIALARQITVRGGKMMTTRHTGQTVEYPGAVNDEARALASKGARTCGCGDTRMVTLPYKHQATSHDGETTYEQEKRYIACVNCDAVHLQPHYRAAA